MSLMENEIIKKQEEIINTLRMELTTAKNNENINLKRALAAEALLEDKNAQIDYLKLEVAMLQNKKYGKSSDKVDLDKYPNLFNFETFNEAEATADTNEPEPEYEEKVIKVRKNKNKNLINRLENLEEYVIEHDLTNEEKDELSTKGKLVYIGSTDTNKIAYRPAKYYKEVHKYHKYKLIPFDNDDNETFHQVKYDLAFPKAMASSSLISNVIVEKYLKAVPLDRQEKLLHNQMFDISKTNLSNWVIESCNYLKPIFNIMHNDILNFDIVYMDETVVEVIKNPNSTCRIWEMVSPKYEKPIILYFFKQTREYQHAKELLNGFKGKYVQSDAYGAYDKIDGVIDVLCWAHAKRKFTDIFKVAKGKHKVHESYCSKAIKYIDSLYHVEHELDRMNASDEERYLVRNEKSKKIIDEYHNFLKEAYEIFSSSSKMGQAIFYSLNNISKLSNYLLDGRLEIDNNRAERNIKPFVIGRKNWLFSYSDVGADSSATIYSVVNTAIENHIKVFEYLIYVFDNMAKYNLDNLTEKDKLEIKDKLLPYSPNLPEYLKVK